MSAVLLALRSMLSLETCLVVFLVFEMSLQSYV